MKARLLTLLRRYRRQHLQRKWARRRARHLRLQVLLLIGALFVLLGWLHPVSVSRMPVVQGRTPVSAVSPGVGQGAGNTGSGTTHSAVSAMCNPFDPPCFLNAMGQTVASNVLSAMQPVTSFFQNSSTNMLTQTPPDDSYGNATIGAINQALVNAVDVALACLLLIAGFNVIIGQHLRLEHTSLAEVLPRALLVTCAVHFNLLFLGLFIDLNNALCNTVIAAASEQTLTNLIASFLSINSSETDSLVVILIIVVLVLSILLVIQMITRIALVALLIAVAPLALACLVLPQTMRWGRLWFSTFSSAVLVQFLQVTALALGGMLISAIGDTAVWHIGHQLALVLLAIGMVQITLSIPRMLQTWALHPMTGSTSTVLGGGYDMLTGGSGSGDSGSSEETAAKLAELLAML